jgi:succinate dehydrogenase / fumarate reductase, membrane anchor subunit
VNEAGRPRPASGLELYAWLFMRISGIALLFLALGHLLIMHLINNVGSIDYRFVAARYATPFWRTYDVVMLWLALVHGLNGARTMVDDYMLSRSWRLAALAMLWLSGFVFLTLGTLVILTFHPILGS